MLSRYHAPGRTIPLFIGTRRSNNTKRQCFIRDKNYTFSSNLRPRSDVPDSCDFHGVYPILVTPFDANDGRIAMDDVSKCISFMHEAKCQGVVVAGVLGEAHRLTDQERLELVQVAAQTVHGVNNANKTNDGTKHFQLIVGATSSNTARTVDLCRQARDAGAHGVMVSPLKVMSNNDEEAILDLYARIHKEIFCDADSTFSIVLQDYPVNSGVDMSVELLQNLIHTFPSIRAIKLESLPTADRMKQLQKTNCPTTCSILTGLGGLYAGLDLYERAMLKLGGLERQLDNKPKRRHLPSPLHSGFMTGFAFPEILQLLLQLADQGDVAKLFHTYSKYLPLIVFEQQQPGGLAIRKEIYRRRGLIQHAQLRLPAYNHGSISEVHSRQLDFLLDQYYFRNVDLTRPIPRNHLLQPLQETYIET